MTAAARWSGPAASSRLRSGPRSELRSELPYGPAPADLPRLLAGLPASGAALSLERHERVHGALPPEQLDEDAVLDLVEASGLRGRGGAGFPVAAKVAAVRRARRPRWSAPVVVANGAGSDPLSDKDRVLLTRAPHLVLDGAQVAAVAVGARRVVAYVPAAEPLRGTVQRALAERSRGGTDVARTDVVTAAPGYVGGEASAAVQLLSGGPGLPTTRPPRMAERGVGGRPTLVLNVETLANLGLLVRHGAGWFRAVGTADEPGSLVVTVHAGDGPPAVAEVELGAPVLTAVRTALGTASARDEWDGGDPGGRWRTVVDRAAAVLVGGTSGRWLPAPAAFDVGLAHEPLAAAGGVLGTAAVLVLDAGSCGLAETARLSRYLAAGSAGQCGPCTNGLPAVAHTLGALAELADGLPDPMLVTRLRRWCASLPDRGACRHPDDSVGLVASALDVFAPDVEEHLAGGCLARDRW